MELTNHYYDINNIKKPHFQEWLDSCVDEQIIKLNVRSLSGTSPYEYLFYNSNIQRLNSGRLATRWLTAYRHIEAGGWWCEGIDEWGSFKPDRPRTGSNGKLIKYEHPVKTATRIFQLKIPLHIWERVALNYGVPMPDDVVVTEAGEALGFWKWVIGKGLPVIITEGAKKAAALLSLGFTAIGLPGIWNGRRVDSVTKSASLIPDLKQFSAGGRNIYFCFDHEEKVKTIAAVNLAIAKTAQLMIAEKCSIKIITWREPQKGVDDFIAANGGEAFEKAYDNAVPFTQWNWVNRKNRSLTYRAAISLDAPDLSTANIRLPDTGIIGISSGKGTGKTKLIAAATATDEKLLSLTHRIFLGRSLAERLGYTWRTDADKASGYYLNDKGNTWRIGSCVESLLAISPDNFKDCTLVIDEVCQVLRALLTSSTCNKEGRRPALLNRFEAIVKSARRIIIADADLDNSVLDYLRTLRDEKEVYLIRNYYQLPGYPCNILDSPDHGAIIAYAVAAAKCGKRLFVACDSKNISKVAAQMIEAGVDEKAILVINSETSEEEEQRDYVRHINQQLSKYKIVIATPSMSTGVSIEGEWFDEVVGIFYGVLPDGDIAQSLARVRPPVPRTIWSQKTGVNFSSVSRSEYPFILSRDLKMRWDLEVQLIKMSLSPELLSPVNAPWTECPHKQLWARMEAANNASMWNLRDNLIARLSHEGNLVTVTSGKNSEVKSLAQKIKKEINQQHYEAVATKGKILSLSERDALESKEGIQTEDRLNLEKTQVADWAAVEREEDITPEVVELWAEKAGLLLRFEDLRYGLAIGRVEKAIAKQAAWNLGLFIPDIPTREQERFIREKLGLMPWIQGLLDGEEFDSEDLEPLGEMVRTYHSDVNRVLRLGFSPNSHLWSNVRIFNRLMKQLGIPMFTEQHGRTKTRIVGLDVRKWRVIEAILDRRQNRRLEQQPISETPPQQLQPNNPDLSINHPQQLEQREVEYEPSIYVKEPYPQNQGFQLQPKKKKLSTVVQWLIQGRGAVDAAVEFILSLLVNEYLVLDARPP